MFKMMIKKMLLAALLLSAAVAPVRVDAINAGALSVIKRVLCIGGGVGFGGLTGLLSYLAFGGYMDSKKHRDPFCEAMAGLSVLGAIPSAVTTGFLFSKGLQGIKINIHF